MPHDALRTILPNAGWPAERADAVEFTGGTDPVLPTPFRIGVAGAATLAATGLAAADLWEIRSGRRQNVGVDLRRATASLRSGHYMKLGDGEVSARRNSIMGVYPTKDGRWSYLHCNFPNHRAAALGVLGVPENREAVARAVLNWNAADLEEAIIAAKGAGGMVRTHAEWAQHPQSAAIAALPLMEIVRIGDSPPEDLPAGDRPLSGVRVLDLTRVLAGPTCARTLAEHGADVLKITGAHLPNLGYQEFDTGHGKLSAQLDLREQRDVDTLRGLVREADVFSQGYRPGTLGGRGLSPEELAAIRPGLVYVSLCAFGHTGPWASRRGFDTVVQTVSGITSRQAEIVPGKTAGPQFYPVSAIDYCTGYLMAFGAMVALGRRAREGGSWLVRISLAQVGKWIVDLGEVPAGAARDAPAEFSPAELEGWSTVTETPSGRLRHLKPTVQLSETPPYWARPSVPAFRSAFAHPSTQGLASAQLGLASMAGDALAQAELAAGTMTPTNRRFRIMGLLFVTVVINYLDRSNISIAAPSMASDFHLDPVQLGLVFSAFSWTYTPFQLPGGWLVDRVHPRILYPVIIMLWSLATLSLGLANGLVMLIVLRMAVGFFEVPTFLINNRIATTWFGEKERATCIAVYTAAESVGLAFLTPVLVWLKLEFGWPSVFFVTGTLGLFWSFVFFRGYRDPAEHPHVNAAEIRKIADSGGIPDLSRRSAAHRAANKGSLLRDLGIVLGRRKLWGIYFGHFVWGTVGTFFRTWFPTYLVTYRHFTFIKAGFYISLPFLAVFIGVLVSGAVSDLLVRRGYSLTFSRKAPIIGGLIFSTSIVGANFVDSEPLIILFLTFAFFCNGVASIHWSLVSATAPERLIGLTSSVFNFMGGIAGILSPIVIGFLLRAGDFRLPLVFIAVIEALGVFSYIFVVGKLERVRE